MILKHSFLKFNFEATCMFFLYFKSIEFQT